MPSVHLWNKAPFIRLLPALMGGIVLQWDAQLPLHVLSIGFFACLAVVVMYFFFSLRHKYIFSVVGGLAINGMVLWGGGLLAFVNDIRNDVDWIGHHYHNKDYLEATVLEPLVEKPNSYKALAQVEAVFTNHRWIKASGKVILYFKKDPAVQLEYGAQLIFNKALQPIKNAGNPGSFDYKRYSLFQGITHQVYLAKTDFKLLSVQNKNAFNEMLFKTRAWVLHVLRKYIHGTKETGLAEALLIGYKDDLDKNLVQSYSNTGVVHVIAISGLHLGLVYWLLLLLTKPLKRNKKLVWLRLVLIITSLWLFSLLAGGQPSVLRSAVMFTCIALGEVIAKRTSIYNTLALSAFVLLCYNPYWLWDVGFQLSYAAVLSIVMFFKPIYNWFYFPNKLVDFAWKLNAVTMAAQLLTLPISIYHFHQLPTLFLFTNMVAVPLSSLILIGEIILCCLFFLPAAAMLLGRALTELIFFMNNYIERLDSIPFSIWNGLVINSLQTFLLVAIVLSTCFWLAEANRKLLWLSLTCFLAFISMRSISLIHTYRQKKIIVYNVPKHQAIDLVIADRYQFIGDATLLEDDFVRNFHIQPSRISNRISPAQPTVLCAKDFVFGNKHISLIDTSLKFSSQVNQNIDLLILSKNPKIYISTLASSFNIRQIVIDGSVPAWKARLWKRDCDSLYIPCYDVSEKGAFVMNL